MWMRPTAGAEDEMEMSEIEKEDYPWARGDGAESTLHACLRGF